MEVDKLVIVQDGKPLLTLEPLLGDHEQLIGGGVLVRSASGEVLASLRPVEGDGGPQSPAGAGLLLRNGQTAISSPDGQLRVIIHGGDPAAGENGGTVLLWSANDPKGPLPDGSPAGAAIELKAAKRTIVMRSRHGGQTVMADGANGNMWVGGNAANGDLMLLPAGAATHDDAARATIHLQASDARLRLGGAGQDGDVVLQNAAGEPTARLTGSHGHAWLGGNGESGLVALFPASADNVTDTTKATMFLDGQRGDIVLQNADCAEDFDIARGEAADPGAVMVLDEDGALRAAARPYDTRVAGVLSGAGDFRPGIVLDRRRTGRPRASLAMVGKAFCKVDATQGPIAAGDLLTTSARRGHAMRATDPARSMGAVIGKALRPHTAGTGLIPVLVALQ